MSHKIKTLSQYAISISFITMLSACGGNKTANPDIGVLRDTKLLSCFDTPPTKDELTKTKEFTCNNIDLSTSNLSELENLPSLITLNLNNTKVSSLEFISNLTNLTKLTILANDVDKTSGISNSVLDISPLASLKKLEVVDLSTNCITDLSAISKLKNLSSLNLNKINVGPTGCLRVDLHPLSVLNKLKTLSLENNAINAGFGYVSAFIDEEGLFVDLSMLSNLTELEHLNLSHSIFAGINDSNSGSGLPYFPKLISLDLSNNGAPDGSAGFDDSLTLKNLTTLSKLTTLKHLDLHSNSLGDVTPIASLTKLSYLNLRKNHSVNDLWHPGSTEKPVFKTLRNLEMLSTLADLTSLDLSQTGVNDSSLRFLTSLPILSILKLDGNYLNDEDVANFPIIESLETLSLKNNWLTKADFLSGLSLNRLDLSHNCIEDFSSLRADILVNENQTDKCGDF